MRSRTNDSLRINDIWTFKSVKSNKRYIVEVEGFDKEFYGIKFYWKGVEKSMNRYSLLTNDFEPRRIIRSCIEIMLNYYSKNNLASFGFIASADLEKDIIGKIIKPEEGSRRFQFYQRILISWFGQKTFYHYSDKNKFFYLLINRFQLDNQTLQIEEIIDKINDIYIGDFLFE
ncbi:MAG: hypothetical protein J1D77_07555 [Muribaculaceae bacterium]|nr:hypothetical protein [Muribaculaceae bacterium]